MMGGLTQQLLQDGAFDINDFPPPKEEPLLLMLEASPTLELDVLRCSSSGAIDLSDCCDLCHLVFQFKPSAGGAGCSASEAAAVNKLELEPSAEMSSESP